MSETKPVIADNLGGTFGIAWQVEGAIKLHTYTATGGIDPLLPSSITVGHGTVQAVGATVEGYAVAYDDGTGLKVTYVSPSGVLDTDTVDTNSGGLISRGAVVAGYEIPPVDPRVDRAPIATGFNVAWTATDPNAPDAADGYGVIRFQRFETPVSATDPRADLLSPEPAGIDGDASSPANTAVTFRNGATTDSAVLIGSLSDADALRGRDLSMTVLHDSEAVLAWVEKNADGVGEHVRVAVLDADGTPLDLPTEIFGNIAPHSVVRVEAINGTTDFLVSWVEHVVPLSGLPHDEIRGQVFTLGAVDNTWTAGGQVTLVSSLPAAFDGKFDVAGLETEGFVLTYQAGDDAVATTFGAGGGLLGGSFAIAGVGNAAVTGVIGDRVVVVDTQTSGSGDVSFQILDTREPVSPVNFITGDDLTRVPPRALPDILIGTVQNDQIDGGPVTPGTNNDELYGAAGDDVLIGGPGNDIVDGGNDSLGAIPARTDTFGTAGSKGDVAVFSGSAADYDIQYLGSHTFIVTDKRIPTNPNFSGTDTVSNVEWFRFGGVDSTNNVAVSNFMPDGPGVDPSPWGLTAESATRPDATGLAVDTGGFIVNRGADAAGNQGNAFVADSVGEFVAVVWETPDASGTSPNDTRIRGQFYDVVGNPDEFIPNAINLSDGIGNEKNARVVSGGANSGWGVVFEETGVSDPLNVSAELPRQLKTNFVGPGTLTGVEDYVDFNEGFDQHDAALGGSFLDRTAQNPIPRPAGEPGSALPAGMNDGYNVAYVATSVTNADGLSTADMAAGYGRIMFQRFEVPFDEVGNPGAPQKAGVDGLADGFDAALWVGTEQDASAAGVIGRNPSTVGTHGFESAVIWIEKDPLTGQERVAGRAYDDLGKVIDVPGFDNISGNHPVAAGTVAHIVQAGAVNLGVVWVSYANGTDASAGVNIYGTMYAPTGTGFNGEGFGFAAPDSGPFLLQHLGVSDIDLAHLENLQFHATGISGEDSEDLIISWTGMTADGDHNMMARHVVTTLDPATGFVLSLDAEAGGNPVQVNLEPNSTAHVQDQGTMAGLLGDRFIAVYRDSSGLVDGASGDDIVARIFDTRAPGQDIVGDLVRAGVVQARRDVLVGTVGDDNIRGDILSTDGLVDTIYGGLGKDTITGGPGLRGAAGSPEFIDGGEGDDTAVYTGLQSDYSITRIAAGYEVIDLRPVRAADGQPAQHDGIDNLFNVEHMVFGDGTKLDLAPVPGVSDYDPTTPVKWSLTDPLAKPIDPTDGQAGVSGIAVTNLQTEAAFAWSSGNEVWGVRYEIQGDIDPVFAAAPVLLTKADDTNPVSDIDIAMTAGLGFTAAWESGSSIHFTSGSTATDAGHVFDPLDGVPGSGLNAVDETVVGSDAAGRVAIDPVVQGYELVNADNDTIEFGFHIAYLSKAPDTPDSPVKYGDIKLARYEIPVYDIDANGNPTTPAAPVDFGRGAETAPISIGADGVRGSGDDLDATTIAQGRDPSLAALHDGQLVVSYVDTQEHVRLAIYVPETHAGDRELRQGADGSDVVVNDVTTYTPLNLSFAGNQLVADLGAVTNGSKQQVVAQLNGSFAVFWEAPHDAADPTGSLDIKGIVYTGAGTTWSASAPMTFKSGLAAGTTFEAAPTGTDPGGLEDGFFLSWQEPGTATHIVGQRFDMAGHVVGGTLTVDEGTAGVTLESASGVEDGRMIVGYADADGDGVHVQFLDNRDPAQTIIGPRTGAPRDVAVGTMGDDTMDGRALDDQLFGGVGNDFITLGSGDDFGDGGIGRDTLIGGSGNDTLLGGDGDDPVIAGGLGLDTIDGGAGKDTISYQGEIAAFHIDLRTGNTQSDRNPATGEPVRDTDLKPVFAAEDSFQNIEDVIAGERNDIITVDGVSHGIDGRGGDDLAILLESRNDYQITGGSVGDVNGLPNPAGEYTLDPNSTYTLTRGAQTVTLTNIEKIKFDGTVPPVNNANQAPTDILAVGGALAVNESSDANGALVGSVVGQDVDGPTLTYSLIDNAAGRFVIDAVTGAISVAAGVLLDFEQAASHSIAVRVSDGIAPPLDKIFTVAVNNVDPEHVVGSAGNNTIVGGVLNDFVDGAGGNDFIDGAGGHDTVLFNYQSSLATLSVSGNDIVVSGPDGTDTLRNVERVEFLDRAIDRVDENVMVDDLFYYAKNPDVWQAKMDPDVHYSQFGWHEGRDPNASFSTSGYLAANPDVAAAAVDPLDHFHVHGWHEGRDPGAGFDAQLYLSHNPDVAAAGMDPLQHYLQFGQAEGRPIYTAIGRAPDIMQGHGFDAEYYLLANPDVARAASASGSDTYAFAQQHYDTFGWHEGRNPNSVFDTNGYETAYADVAAAGMNPLTHYDTFGWHEGRDPSTAFDTVQYLSHYADVAAAAIDPLAHYLAFGALEGRSTFADGHFA